MSIERPVSDSSSQDSPVSSSGSAGSSNPSALITASSLVAPPSNASGNGSSNNPGDGAQNVQGTQDSPQEQDVVPQLNLQSAPNDPQTIARFQTNQGINSASSDSNIDQIENRTPDTAGDVSGQTNDGSGGVQAETSSNNNSSSKFGIYGATAAGIALLVIGGFVTLQRRSRNPLASDEEIATATPKHLSEQSLSGSFASSNSLSSATPIRQKLQKLSDHNLGEYLPSSTKNLAYAKNNFSPVGAPSEPNFSTLDSSCPPPTRGSLYSDYGLGLGFPSEEPMPTRADYVSNHDFTNARSQQASMFSQSTSGPRSSLLNAITNELDLESRGYVQSPSTFRDQNHQLHRAVGKNESDNAAMAVAAAATLIASQDSAVGASLKYDSMLFSDTSSIISDFE